MAYLINKSDGTILLNLEDGILDTSTSLGLLGRNYIGYGEVQNENFVYLLENFANNNPPARPTKGQAWYDSSSNRLNVYTGEQWIPVGAAAISEDPPPEFLGSLWVKIPNNQLFIFLTNGWELIGPEAALGFDKTRAESTILKDVAGVDHAVIIFRINGIAEGIVATEPFTISPITAVPGFFNLLKGINSNSTSVVQSRLVGNADTSSKLETPRKINNVEFDGSADITITASTSNSLTNGDYILGNTFNGSQSVTWDVNATSLNSIGSLVARDSAGDFEANNITATSFTGTLLGNVNVSQGTSGFNNINVNDINGRFFSGLSATTQRLATGRFINGVLFDGTQDITVTASASTLTGTTLNGTVTTSSLNQVGVLNNLQTLDAGILIGVGNTLKLSVESNVSTITSSGRFDIVVGNLGPSISFVTSVEAQSAGAPYAPAIFSNNATNIGGPATRFNNIYANNFIGNASTATALQSARTINGVPFDGTQGISILDNTKLPLAGGTVTGSLNIDGNLTIPTSRIVVGTATRIDIGITADIPTLNFSTSTNLNVGADGPQLSFATSADALTAGGPASPAILSNNNINLGGPSKKFDRVYANLFVGNASTASRWESTRVISLTGSITGSANIDGTGNIAISTFVSENSIVLGTSTVGQYARTVGVIGNGLSCTSPNSDDGTLYTITSNATNVNTANTIVFRDAGGNFSAGTITSSLIGNVTGNVTGNAGSATRLQTARRINDVPFDGTQDISIADNSKLPIAGGTITGGLTVNGNVVASLSPVIDSHLANKFYVDNKRYTVKIYNAGTTGTVFTANWDNGEIQYVTANSNFTLNAPSNMPSGTSLTIIITQDANGSKTLTPVTGYVFASGYKTLSTVANSVDMLNIFRADSTYYVTLTTGYAA